MLVVMTHLFVGALHGHFNIVQPSSAVAVALDEKAVSNSDTDAGRSDVSHSDKGVVADHPCHGCFSVSMPALVTAASTVDTSVQIAFHHDADRLGQLSVINLPPPKFQA
ncbi:hypothetical protein [Afipia carboxidovorans]|nr:hypothetical protein [Afipia carboxidovorans]